MGFPKLYVNEASLYSNCLCCLKTLCLTPSLTFTFEMQKGETVRSLSRLVPGHQRHWWWQTDHWELKMGYLVSGVREATQSSRKMRSHVICTTGCLYRPMQHTSGCKGSLKVSAKLLVAGMWLMVEWAQLPSLRGFSGVGSCQANRTWCACPAGAGETHRSHHGPRNYENRQPAPGWSLCCGSNHRERSVLSFWSKQFWLVFAVGNWTILRSLKEINPFTASWML